jgi:hypothetical protein
MSWIYEQWKKIEERANYNVVFAMLFMVSIVIIVLKQPSQQTSTIFLFVCGAAFFIILLATDVMQLKKQQTDLDELRNFYELHKTKGKNK